MKHILTLAALVFATSCFGQVPDYVPTDGLVAWLSFNNGVLDEGPLNNTATDFGSEGTFDRFGLPDAARNFNAARVELANSDVIDQFKTVSQWTRTESSSRQVSFKQNVFNGALQERVIITQNFNGDNCHFGIKESCGAPWNYGNQPFVVSDGEWHHFVGVVLPEETRLYVDGALISTTSIVSDSETCTGGDIIIGSEWSGVDYDFQGDIDDVGLWDRPLGEEEILGLYLADAPNYGCTNEEACNFNPEANVDDSSCIPSGCMDSQACNFNPVATCDDGSCDYCSCVGEVVFGANFDDVLIQYGANELFTTDEDLDLSSIEDQRILDVEGGEGYFIVMNEDSTLTTLCEGCLYGNPPPSTWKVLDVEVGRHEGCLVRADGSLHSFGANYLGLQNEPTVDNAIQCAASWSFHMALLGDGEIVGWGNGWEPCPLPLSDVVEIDAGGGHAVALMENGTLVEWGRMEDGSVAHSHEWILDLEQVVHVVAGQNSTWMFFADGSAQLVEFPSGNIWLELPAGSGVVDGDRNWAVTSYLKNDGEVFIQQNSGTSEIELDLSAHENCGTCVLDSDQDGTCNLDEVFGCADEAGCNYAEDATQNAGCVYPILPEADCSAGSVVCGEGTVWDMTTQTCLSAPSDQGPCLNGTIWDEDLQGCIVANPSDTDYDGCVSMTDLLDLLSVFGTCDEVPWSCGDPLEYQGYDYETVLIGEQCWFAEDLRSTHFLDGSPIPSLHETGGNWTDLTEPAYGYYEMENGISDETPLFNHFVVQDDRGVCPSGWKVPAIEDMPVGSPNGVWPNLEYRGYINADPGNPLFMGGGIEVWYWSETIEDDRAYDIGIWSFDDHIVSGHHIYQYGFSIRCIQDSE
jgi:hypothetical protein